MSEASISVKLGELLELVIDHRGKTPKKMGFEDFHQIGYPVLSAKHVKNGELVNTESIRFANEDMYRKWMKVEVEEGDIILTSEAPLGKVFYLDGPKKYVLGQRVFGLRPRKSLVDPVYLTVWLTSTNGQAALVERATGSTVLGIKQSELLKIEVDLPDSKIQLGIAKVYRSFNDKIALNRKLNATLEAMAQALFQSWFVDFDPVKAKLAAVRCGRDPEQAAMAAIACKLVVPPGKPKAETLDAQLPSAEAIDAAIAALDGLSEAQRQSLKEKAAHFPADFQESELGLIPLGWEVTVIGNVSSCFDSKRIPLSKRQREQRKGSYPYYGATSVMDYVDDFLFDDTLILIGEDGSVLRDDGTPFLQFIWGKVWVNNHAHVVKGSNGISTEELYLFFYGTNISARVTGAVQLKLNQKNMNSIPFIRASEELHKCFEVTVKPLFEELKALTCESRTFADLRDALLPKLLSGEISVSPN